MFRNLVTVALIILGSALYFGDPDSWKWPDMFGVYVVQAVTWLAATRPFSVIICFVIATALWMTRVQY